MRLKRRSAYLRTRSVTSKFLPLTIVLTEDLREASGTRLVAGRGQVTRPGRGAYRAGLWARHASEYRPELPRSRPSSRPQELLIVPAQQ